MLALGQFSRCAGSRGCPVEPAYRGGHFSPSSNNDCHSVSTDKSIDIAIGGVVEGVAGGLASKFGEEIYLLLRKVLKLAYDRLKRDPPHVGRPNLTRRRIDLLEHRRRILIEIDENGNVARREVVYEGFEVVDAMAIPGALE